MAESAKQRSVRSRLELLEAIQRIPERLSGIAGVLRSAQSREDAVARLVDEFGLSPVAAQAVLDAPMASLTDWRQDRIAAEVAELRAQLTDGRD